jgi:hypothetical protein
MQDSSERLVIERQEEIDHDKPRIKLDKEDIRREKIALAKKRKEVLRHYQVVRKQVEANSKRLEDERRRQMSEDAGILERNRIGLEMDAATRLKNRL